MLGSNDYHRDPVCGCQHSDEEWEESELRGNFDCPTTGCDGMGEYILDECGEKIPMDICICAARSTNECCCGAWWI